MTQYFVPSMPSTAFITNTYDELGRVRAQTDAAGNTTNLYFTGTRAEMDDALGNAHVLYFSPRGKALIDIDALGYQTVNTHEGLDRLASTTLPLGISLHLRRQQQPAEHHQQGRGRLRAGGHRADPDL